jgi:hypothetical protein
LTLAWHTPCDSRFFSRRCLFLPFLACLAAARSAGATSGVCMRAQRGLGLASELSRHHSSATNHEQQSRAATLNFNSDFSLPQIDNHDSPQ